MSHLFRWGKNMVLGMADLRASSPAPVGKMLAGSLLLYGLLCLYGFSRM